MKTIDGKIPLYFWNHLSNFGDQMSKDIVEFFLNTTTVHVEAQYRGKLLAIGSILDKCMPGDVVWGSGVHPRFYRESGDNNFWPFIRAKIVGQNFSNTEFIAVRGPVTQQYLIQNGGPCVDVFGDPAILAPIVYPKILNPVRRHLLINHFSVTSPCTSGMHCVNPADDWRNIVDEICKSEMIISSSLHGLILAETYGVPAVFLRNSREGLMKYIDYYASTNRFPVIANSIEDAIFKSGLLEPPDFSSLRNNLLSSIQNWKARNTNV